MTDRPIIFSGPMVRALLAGLKTQTRRLATSPLSKVQVGGQLYVREEWCTDADFDHIKPSALDVATPLRFAADGHWSNPYEIAHVTAGRRRPGMHMPRWASRLTLIVEGVKVEPVQAITEEDAVAEGLEFRAWDVEEGDDAEIIDGWSADRFLAFKRGVGETAREGYKILWNSLHTKPGERWEDNPYVVALIFSVHHKNIDR